MKTIEPFQVPGTSVEPLFEAWHAGHVDALPASVIAHGRGYLAIAAAQKAAEASNVAAKAADGQATRLQAIDAACAEAVATGHVPGDPAAPLVAARHAAEDAALTLSVLSEARQRQLTNLESVVALEADAIVLSHLRPAFEQVLADVAAVAPDLSTIDVTDSASIAAGGPSAAKGYLILCAARARLDALHACLQVVRTRARRGQEDRDNRFRDTRAFPAKGHGIPGPAHPLERLLWLAADPDAAPWLPGLDEWTTRHHDFVFRDTPHSRPEYVEALNAARQERLDAAIAQSRAAKGKPTPKVATIAR